MALDHVRGDAESPEVTPGRRGAFVRRHRVAVVVPLAYVAGAVWLYWPLARHLGSAQMGGPDTSLFTWWLGWTPWAIIHGHSPFVSTWINAPTGLNEMWNTSVPLLGVLMAPITLTLGPVTSENLLLIAAPALSAYAAYVAGRLLGLRMRSSFLVGFLYGFSTNIIAENSSGHLHLSMAIFPPLVAALLQRIVTGTVSARKGGLLLGLAAVLQVWVSEELLATSGILAALVLLLLAARAPRDTVAQTARRLARTAGWALLVVIPVAAPALWVQFFGADHLTSGVPVDSWSTDVFTSITPTRQALAGRLVSDQTMARIQVSDYDEITGYVGLPLIVLLLAARRRIRTTTLRWCWVPLLVAAVLALGWTLRIAGHDTGIPGPARLMAHLPVLQNIVMVRYSLYVVLFAALLVGAAWDSAALAPVRAQRWTAGLVALAVLAVLPQHSANITRIDEPAAFASGHLVPGIPDGSTIAMLPWPTTADASAMRWQVVDRLHYKLLGAWGIVAGPGGAGQYGSVVPLLNGISHELRRNPRDRPPVGSYAEHVATAELHSWGRHARALVVGPGGDERAVADYVGGLLHEKPRLTGGVFVLTLPST